MSLLVRYRLHFVGHVQGIGFRPTLIKYATRRHCTGWVRNEPDPTQVTAELQGTEQAIAAVLRSLDSRFNDGVWHRGFSVAEQQPIPVVDGEQDMRVRKAEQ